jgi:hypothetical protein
MFAYWASTCLLHHVSVKSAGLSVRGRLRNMLLPGGSSLNPNNVATLGKCSLFSWTGKPGYAISAHGGMCIALGSPCYDDRQLPHPDLHHPNSPPVDPLFRSGPPRASTSAGLRTSGSTYSPHSANPGKMVAGRSDNPPETMHSNPRT